MYNSTVRRQHKDTVFRMLFKEKTRLLELFNAINNTDITDENEIEITTLENAIYMTTKNDISCVVDMRLSLFEHQSTVNPNMPLRDLDYVSKCFSRYVTKRDLYSGKKVILPNPKFVVFYNGLEEQPQVKMMRLSDLYAHREDNPNLELVVVQYNINSSKDAEILKQCQTLKEYSQFIDCIRKHQEHSDNDTAVGRAIDECIDKGILEDFLRANRAEVEAVSVYEFDEKLHEDTIKEIAYSEGYAKGEESGYTTGYAKGEESGYTTGYAKGEEAGYAKGEESGYAKGEESGYTTGYAKGEESGYAKGEESGYARGEESGYAKGEESGFARGEKSGYINGEIYGRVKAYHELNVSITEIASKVGISVDKVVEILNG